MNFYDKIIEMDWDIKNQSSFQYNNMYDNIENLSFLDSFIENNHGEYFSVSCYETLENRTDFIMSVKQSGLYAVILSKSYPVFKGEKTAIILLL